MEYGQVVGLDAPVSRLVQGTTMLKSADLPAAYALLDAVFAHGGTTFDTAHGYGEGDCERVFGGWLRERGLRDQVVIIGKGAHHNRDRRRVTPFDITADLHDSLARMRVEAVDLYLLHRDDPAVPVGPIVAVLDEHRRAGKLLAYGGSNWSAARIAEANAYAADHGLAPFVASSPNVSLAVPREIPWPDCISLSGPDGAADRAWCAEHDIPLFAWSSLAGGFFSGRFTPENLDSFTTYNDTLVVRCYADAANFGRLERAQTLAAEHGLTVAQVALAYVLSLPQPIFALVGCATGAEFANSAAALDLKLTDAQRAWLEG